MIRKIICIDQEACIGCGLCAQACHEGAIGMVEGKAQLLRDDYCDGLGDCLPACPVEAISFVEREAAAYDEEAVQRHQREKSLEEKETFREENQKGSCFGRLSQLLHPDGRGDGTHGHQGGCPGSRSQVLRPESGEKGPDGRHQGGCPGSRSQVLQTDQDTSIAEGAGQKEKQTGREKNALPEGAGPATLPSQLRQWPCQIQLAPLTAPYFHQASLLIAADCTAYAYAGLHQEYMQGRCTLIGCPKLDPVDYSEKLTAILQRNAIQSVTLVRMEVPCCGGLENALRRALEASGQTIPWQVVTISIDGRILNQQDHSYPRP